MANQDYDNELRGALFINDHKDSDRHPDYKGSATIDGVDYWVSAWVKAPRNGGDNFLSMAFTPKGPNQSTNRGQQQSSTRSAQDFLTANREKIDKHKSRPQSPQAPQQPPADYDHFDDDIPF